MGADLAANFGSKRSDMCSFEAEAAPTGRTRALRRTASQIADKKRGHRGQRRPLNFPEAAQPGQESRLVYSAFSSLATR